jgi:TolB protein
MRIYKMIFPALITGLMFSCGAGKTETQPAPQTAVADQTAASKLHYDQEKHLMNIRQLTFGGDNAEAYFSFDNKFLTFQSNNENWGLECDQIFYFDWKKDNLQSQKPKLISTGLGRTTCAYFMPGNKSILFASTHSGDHACPKAPVREDGAPYAWPIYPDYDIYVADLKGKILDTIISGPGYDAEATVSPKGDKIVFTSTRSGDLELYVCNIDGSNVVQITHELGYDGGAFFSPDGSKIVFRASRPKTPEAIEKYKYLLSKNLVEPTQMDIYVCHADGSNLKKVTDLGKASWAPFYHPDNKRILFSSNHHTQRGFPFNIFMINEDGTGLQQITFDTAFDAFPMFSFDGKKLIFSSNRINGGTRATNLFIADWVE